MLKSEDIFLEEKKKERKEKYCNVNHFVYGQRGQSIKILSFSSMFTKSASLYLLSCSYAAILTSAASSAADTPPQLSSRTPLELNSAEPPRLNVFKLPSVVTRLQRPSTANMGLSRPTFAHPILSPHATAESVLDPSWHIVTQQDLVMNEDVNKHKKVNDVESKAEDGKDNKPRTERVEDKENVREIMNTAKTYAQSFGHFLKAKAGSGSRKLVLITDGATHMIVGAGLNTYGLVTSCAQICSDTLQFVGSPPEHPMQSIQDYAAPLRAASRDRYRARQMLSNGLFITDGDPASSSRHVMTNYPPLTFKEYFFDLAENEFGEPIGLTSADTADYLKDLTFYQLTRLSTEELIRKLESSRAAYLSIGFDNTELSPPFILKPSSGIGALFRAVGRSRYGFGMFYQQLEQGSPDMIERVWGGIIRKAAEKHAWTREYDDGTLFRKHPEHLEWEVDMHEERQKNRVARGLAPLEHGPSVHANAMPDIVRTALQAFDLLGDVVAGTKLTRELVNSRYRKEILKYHPDKSRGQDSSEAFRGLESSRKVLMDYIEGRI